MAAISGASIMLVLSPTPPVECLSTFAPGMPSVFRTVPEFSIARVRETVSASVIPLRYTAIRKAEAWYSGMAPPARPATKKAISSPPSSPPSRFFLIMSCALTPAPA
jgi:hypothetical protein